MLIVNLSAFLATKAFGHKLFSVMLFSFTFFYLRTKPVL